jgi:hypothetical protein
LTWLPGAGLASDIGGGVLGACGRAGIQGEERRAAVLARALPPVSYPAPGPVPAP